MLFRSMILSLLLVGSGCQSLFTKRGDGVGDGLQGVLLKEANGSVRVLAVEKPGVEFQDMPARPGTAEGAGAEFLKEHTLPRWAEANAAALKAAWTLPGVDAGRTLVIGHSEGAIVAARVAADLPGVTHVASLAGGGPTQLFSLAELASRPRPDGGTAAIHGTGLPRPWHERRGDPRNGLRPRPGRTRRSRPRRDGRTTRRRGSRISHRIDAERVAGRVASRLRARADVVPGGGGQAQMSRRTNRCSRQRPRFRFLGVQRLSARPPLPSFGVR